VPGGALDCLTGLKDAEEAEDVEEAEETEEADEDVGGMYVVRKL